MQAEAPHATAPTAPAISIEDEVLGNLRGQPLGPGTVADLYLPELYLRRVADRVIRSSFEERWRIVLSDAEIEATAKAIDHHSAASESGSSRTWVEPLAYGAGGLLLLFLAVVFTSRRRRA